MSLYINFCILWQEDSDRRVEKIFQEIENMFSNSSAAKHLVLKHRIFLNAMDLQDPDYGRLKKVLVELLCSQPSWGEKLPKAWIYLKMMINKLVEKGKNVISIEKLKSIDKENPVQTLSDAELNTFLKMYHSQGEIIYFPVKGLKENIIISPKFLVDALRSLITDKRFCEDRRLKGVEYMHKNGVLQRTEIIKIWKGKNKFLKHKHYLISLMEHLDIIATPRRYGTHGALSKSDLFYVPCMVTANDETNYLKRDLKLLLLIGYWDILSNSKAKFCLQLLVIG